jgi:two-component sensor histidine kinase
MTPSRAQDISRREADSLLRSLRKADADTAHINSLLKLALFEIHKPGEFKVDLDSAALFINQAKQINDKIRSVEAYGYITLIESYFEREKGRQKEAKASVEKAIQILRNGTDKLQLGQAYMELSDYYDYRDPDQISQKRQLVEQAVNSFKLSGNIERMAYSLRMLGEFYNESVDSRTPGSYRATLDTALEKCKLSLALYQSIHYENLQGIYVMLGEIYSSLADFGQYFNYELMALKAAEKVQDTTMQLSQINNQIGTALLLLKEHEKAIDYFKTAIRIAEKYKDNEAIFEIAINIANAYVSLQKPLEAKAFLENISKKYTPPQHVPSLTYRIADSYLRIYMPLKQYRLARPYCDQLLSAIRNDDLAPSQLIYIHSLLIQYYYATKQYSAELVYLRKNEVLTLRSGGPINIANNNRLWFRLDSVLHDYKSEITHLLIYDRIKDSLYTVTKSRQAQQLQVQFETEKKENQIRLLNEREKLDQANLRQANLVGDVTIGGILVVLIIAGLLYRQYRQKQKANLAITQKNELLQHLLTEKEWLLKEVHHRVKNNLHTVICLLESQAYYLENDALRAIEISQHRIYAMSLIHQKIYQSEDIKTIDMANYLPEFIQYLRDSFGSPGHIWFQLDIEALHLGVSQAIPVALIVNEAVTNSIKYAFPGNRPGEIAICLHQAGEQIRLSVSDNGIGMAPALRGAELNSLGIELMKGLSRELKGSITFETDRGTRIAVLFDVDPLSAPQRLPTHSMEKEVAA